MPPKTADAADALRSVRREKLIGFSLEGLLFLRWRDVASHPCTCALIAASARGGNTGLWRSRIAWAKWTPVRRPGWLGLL